MIDIKYHIVSVIAIFCALGIGVFIGSNIIGNDVLVQQQKEVVSSLEQEFNILREQNKITQQETAMLKGSLDKYRSFGEQVLPLVVKDQLSGKKVAVVETNSQGFVGKVEQALILSGAEVAYTVILDWKSAPDWRVLIMGDNTDKPLSKKELYGMAAAKLASIMCHGQDMITAGKLIDCGFLQVEGELGERVDAVIIIDGNEENLKFIVENYNLPLAEYFLEQGVSVVVGEYENALFSYLDKYKLKPFTTIDNLDSPIGLTSVVFAVMGHKGNFGVGQTSERLIPDIDSQ